MDRSEFREDYEEGLLSEEQVSTYLHRHILDEQDKAFLTQNNITIPMILNGRYNSAQFSEPLKVMVEKWNAALGFTVIYPEYL